ncbi:MAG: RsfS/YbeB/iojap family protein, partial [Steroidobacteraceae bacterium]|nr:RsfS/YbeB/iojap family protein [Steroidobacteraceae bacterium]
ECRRDREWVMVDVDDVIVHVMLPRTREFYGLERLWEGGGASAATARAATPARRKAKAGATKARGSAKPAGASARAPRPRSH